MPHLKACDGDFPGGRRQCLDPHLPQNKSLRVCQAMVKQKGESP